MSIILPNNRSSAPLTRRSVLVGLAASFLAAPAIVRASSIMPVRRVLITEPVLITAPDRAWDRTLAPGRPQEGFARRLMFDMLAKDLLRGDITTVINGRHPSLSEAERTVRYAPNYGFLSPQREAQIRRMFQGHLTREDIDSVQPIRRLPSGWIVDSTSS